MNNLYSSHFALQLESLEATKHNAGFSLKYMGRHLRDFDSFCHSRYPGKNTLDKELTDAWIFNTKTHSAQELEKRVRTMVHLGRHLLSQGLDAYVADNRFPRLKPREPYIFTDSQLAIFFMACDSLASNPHFPYRHMVVPVMFRMIYCCGLRNAEAGQLKKRNVDLNNGTLCIYESKGHKSRTVYMSDDLTVLCRKYDLAVEALLPARPYFFPSPGGCYLSSSVCRVFDTVMDRAGFAKEASKKPTCHGLRHVFTVNSMRKCLAEGKRCLTTIF